MMIIIIIIIIIITILIIIMVNAFLYHHIPHCVWEQSAVQTYISTAETKRKKKRRIGLSESLEMIDYWHVDEASVSSSDKEAGI